MSQRPPQAEYLVISRGQWDRTLSRDEIQNAIDRFYIWLDRMVDEGKMKLGQRLTYEGRKVVRQNVVTDGPFGESKEVIGGYWFILAYQSRRSRPDRQRKPLPGLRSLLGNRAHRRATCNSRQYPPVMTAVLGRLVSNQMPVPDW